MKSLLFILLCPVMIFARSNYDKYFLEKTMRFDFFHVGNKDKEQIVFDEIIEEPEWGGSKTDLIDDTNYGNYFFKLFDKESKQLIYSRGFSTLFQEWQTTEEAMHLSRTFEGSIVFPYPATTSILEIYKRDKKNIFQKLFEYEINPENYFISKERRMKYENFKVHYSGEPQNKLDIVFLPEGYSINEKEKYIHDCKRFADTLFNYSPFQENEGNINIWAVEAYSQDTGVDIPAENKWKNSILNSTYYTFDSERYVMTSDYKKVRDLASNAPYDQIYILVNSAKYGGGAIYNFYSALAVDCNGAGRVFIHEFGHGMAGLADEYAGDVSYVDMYPLDVEPWEENITTLVDFDSKWKSLLEEGTLIPTPVDGSYELKSIQEKLKLGAFEGGGYVTKGVYRASYDSIMRTLAAGEFNLASKKALIKILNMYIDSEK
ncbi:MAG: M64 family metallopeptidase [bacterium]